MPTDAFQRYRLVLLVIPALLAACHRGPGDSLSYGSASDVAEILRANGVKASSLSCKNPKLSGNVIRAVSCTLRLAPAEVATLSAAVPLAPGSPRYAPPGHSDSCEATPGLTSKDPGVEVLVEVNSKVGNGASRISVHLVRTTGAACIEIEYPWSS